MSLRAIHTVLLTPNWAADQGKNWDPKKFVKLAVDANVVEMEVYCKNALGQAFFAFRGRPCPRDWVTETRWLAKKAGLKFIVYYNVGLDNWMADKQSDWVCVGADRKRKCFGDTFVWMCLRSPWREKVLQELLQIQDAIQPDGYWLDLCGAPNSYGKGSLDPAAGCFCKHCRKAYRDQFGADLPEGSDDPAVRRQVYAFAQAARTGLLREAFERLRACNRNLSLSYNHAGDFWDRMAAAGPPADLVTLNSLEAKAHLIQSFKAKALWSQGKPFQIHSYGGFQCMDPGSAVGTWVDWNLIPSAYMDVSAAVVTAHAGRLCVGVNPLPDGSIYEDELKGLGRTFAKVAQRQPWLMDTQSVPNVAVVYDADSELALNSAIPPQSMLNEAIGLHDGLVESGTHFDVVHSDCLRTAGHKAIFLGNAVCPGAKLTEALRSFVAEGGLLVATHETSLRDESGRRRANFELSNLFGVRFEGVSPHEEANYALLGEELRGDGPAQPVLFTSQVLHVRCTAARPLAELVYPEAKRTAGTCIWQTQYNHPKHRSGRPLITANKVGRGTVVYIAAPIGEQIHARHDTWLKGILARIVRLFAPGLAVKVQAPPGVQVVFARRAAGAAGPAGHVLSLINRYAGMIVGAGQGPHPQVGPIEATISVDALGYRPENIEAIDAAGLRWEFTGQEVRIRIDSITHHAVCLLK